MTKTFPIISLLGSFANTALFIYLIRKYDDRKEIFIFASAVLFFSFWGVFDYLKNTTFSLNNSVLWTQLVGLSAFTAVFLFTHFCLSFSNFKLKKRGLVFFYSPIIFLIFSIFKTDLFYKSIKITNGVISREVGPLFGVMGVMAGIYLFTGVYALLKKYFSEKSILERQKTKLIIIGILFSISIAFPTNVIFPLLGIDFVELGTFGLLIMAFTIGYALLKYDLFNIDSDIFSKYILESLPDYIFFLTPSGRIAKVNDEVVRHGYDIRSIKGQEISKVISLDFDELLIKKEENNENNIKRKDVFFFSKKEGKKEVNIIFRDINDNIGRNLGFLLILKDISKEKKLVRKLDSKVKKLTNMKKAMLNILEDVDEYNKKLSKSNKKLKKLDDKKDEFISLAAHELKTPLTAIHGFSQLLKDKKVFENDQKRRKYLDLIDKETGRLGDLINNVLNLSRIDLGNLKYSFQKLDPNKLLNEVKETIIHLAENKGIELVFSADNLPNMVTDEDKLKRIIINLISNAIKYTKEGKVVVSARKQEDEFYFEVKDTGIGIPESSRSQLFDRFYRVESTYTRNVKGTGLGLPIAKEMIEGMGGNIDYESEEGKGSKFYFTIPYKRKKTVKNPKGKKLD